MLKALAGALAFAAGIAHADRLARPTRLTVGAGDQLLGALSPDGKRLYYASTENATAQLFVVDLLRPTPRLLFDEAADVTAPRPSADGKRLLYISQRHDAAGDLCVAEGDERRCLSGPASAEVQALWLADGRPAAVTRHGIDGDLELRAFDGKNLSGEVVIARNLSSPTAHGDFIVYVPIERGARRVGPGFAVQAGIGLEARRLSNQSTTTLRFDLPGVTAFPAFSFDGRWLYFTQYLNDTNLDGIIDGNDHGVLFRAAWKDGQAGAPQQLTSAAWNCQYPAPGVDRLIATCLFEGSLDVYSLPLAGAVPETWNEARIRGELLASRERWTKLLLLAHLPPDGRTLGEMLRLHLELGELESAEFYTRELGGSDSELAAVMLELVAQRRAKKSLSRGHPGDRFVAESRARLGRLRTRDDAPPSLRALATVVRAEVHDGLGERNQATAELASLDVAPIDRPVVLQILGASARELWRDLDDRAAPLQLFATLSSHRAFELDEQLDWAEAFVAELSRGRAADKRAALFEAERARLDPGSNLAFVLDVERALLPLDRASQEPVRARLFEIYRANRELRRRETLVDATVREASRRDCEELLYQFANTWVSFVDRAAPERARAEQLYANVVLERAYVEERNGKIGDARAHHYGVTLQATALEAHAGFIEMRLREGKTLNGILAEYEKRYPHDEPPLRFARAYLIARELPSIPDDARHAALAAEALSHLQSAMTRLPPQRELHLLWAFIAAQRYSKSGKPSDAVEANTHGLLALDLAGDHPRTRAAVLSLIGRIQTLVGNHDLALGHWEARARLPYLDDEARLGDCLAEARAAWSAISDEEGAKRVERCEALARAQPKFLPVVLDASALYHLTARDFTAARARYAELEQLAGTSRRNRFTAALGLAAALAGEGKEDARPTIARARELVTPPARSRASAAELRLTYGLILDGLEAQVAARQRDWPAARAAMTRRRDVLQQRARKGVDEVLPDLAAAEASLAGHAEALGDLDGARAHLEAALRHLATFATRTGTEDSPLAFDVLGSYVALYLDGKLPHAQFAQQPVQRLEHTHARLSRLRNPAWEAARARLGQLLTLVRLDKEKR